MNEFRSTGVRFHHEAQTEEEETVISWVSFFKLVTTFKTVGDSIFLLPEQSVAQAREL